MATEGHDAYLVRELAAHLQRDGMFVGHFHADETDEIAAFRRAAKTTAKRLNRKVAVFQSGPKDRPDNKIVVIVYNDDPHATEIETRQRRRVEQYIRAPWVTRPTRPTKKSSDPAP